MIIFFLTVSDSYIDIYLWNNYEYADILRGLKFLLVLIISSNARYANDTVLLLEKKSNRRE